MDSPKNMKFPFKEEKLTKHISLRSFDPENFNEDGWHRDAEDRIVEVVSPGGWSIQFDNELPIVLNEGSKFFIPNNVFHRVIKGEDDLVVTVDKNPSQDSINEARSSTEGYIYEVVARMVTERGRNKSEIINDLRAIRDVTVVSIIPGQQSRFQRSETKENTLIKIKFEPGSYAVAKLNQIKNAAFGVNKGAACIHSKIKGLISLDYKVNTLRATRTY